MDIGPATIDRYRDRLAEMCTVVWNGPPGRFEMPPYRNGTEALARVLAALEATTVVGGGETTAAVRAAGVEEDFDHVSTGGGAFLVCLGQRDLPAVRALEDRESQEDTR